MMNCEQARHLLDGYLDDELNRYERQRLEAHLASCPKCVDELRNRSSLEYTIRHALTSSAQHRSLTSEVSSRIVSAAQGGVRQGIWANYTLIAMRSAATLAALVLVVIGLLLLLERAPAATATRPITLPPVIQLALSELNPFDPSSTQRPTLPEQRIINNDLADGPALSMGASDLRIEPYSLQPSDWFTITVVVHSELVEAVDVARLNLEIDGPKGRYEFPLAVKGPLPTPGVSVLQVTPDNLSQLCEDRYLISPTAMFKTPGVYTVRVTLFSPVSQTEQ